ncbi:MAG: ABC transporter permease [Candidatus Woesearchaeota archaeon]
MNKNSKIGTIIKHEYLTKVKSKGFIIGTILGPIFLIAVIFIPILITYATVGTSERKILIIDNGTGIGKEIVNRDPTKFEITDEPLDSLKSKLTRKAIDGYFVLDSNVIAKAELDIFLREGGGVGTETTIDNIKPLLKYYKTISVLDKTSLDSTSKKAIFQDFKFNKITPTIQGEKRYDGSAFAGLGYLLGFAIYMMVLMYGTTVMRGVIEEKANRIIEVIASSAKPYEIMMGKVIGIGLVGLTQIIVWTAFVIIIMFFGGAILKDIIPASAMKSMSTQDMSFVSFVFPSMTTERLLLIILCFIFYFLSGYFIYSSIFAAIGSAVDQESDAQQLQFPVMIPIILPILLLPAVMNNPESTLSTILSLFPFFTPILMTVRVAATDVPILEIILSFILLIGTFVLCVWFASKIYRVGILMYGKKPYIKDIIKWFKNAKN